MSCEYEYWMFIEGYPGYMVSDLGNVFSVKHNKVLTPVRDTKGYYQVKFFANSISKTRKVHILVANAFLDNPLNKPTVDHINGVKTDNRLCNLRFATHQEQYLNRKGWASNPTGVRGVTMKGNKFVARLIIDGVMYYIGSFKTLEEAKNGQDSKSKSNVWKQ